MSILNFEKKCRVCGCTETSACHHPTEGNCWWVDNDLCSHCAITEIRDSGKVIRNKPLDLKFKVGDKVEIIPDDKYLPEIKKFYGKSFPISRIVFDKDGTPLYKCKGVPGYALESGLKSSII